MKTQTSMLSSLAIAALATVTLNPTEALAKGGGPGGMSGMRSFSMVRTTPMVLTKYKALNTTPIYKKPTVKKLTPTAVVTRKLNTGTPFPVTGLGTNPAGSNPAGTKTFPVVGLGTNPSGTTTNPGGTTTNPGGTTTNPGGTIHLPGGTIQVPPVVFNPPGNGVPPIKLPPGNGIVVDPVHPIQLPPGGGIVVGPPLPPTPPAPPPVVVNPPPVVVTPPVSVGVAAPVAVEAPGCVYERSVRKLPDGGLQRVIVKVCPDVIVQ